MNPTNLTLITCIVLTVVVALFIHHRSKARLASLQTRLDQAKQDLCDCRKHATEYRELCGQALESQEEQHQDELRRLRDARAETSQRYRELSNYLQATALTTTELQLVEDMANKLRLASSSLHATQQFADARQAKELAHRGDLLLQRLQPRDAKGEAA